jgi:transcriptional regulator
VFTPSLFRESDLDRLFDLIDAHPFGTLVAQTQGGGLEISHLPFLLDRSAGTRGRLRFHVARANPVWRAALEGGQVVAVFRGPDAYVSPTWYEHPEEQVPTWNYAVVHAHGRVEGPLGPPDMRRLLDEMAARHEKERAGGPAPWRLSDMAPGHVDELIGAIVGLVIQIDHLEGKFKLSQNRAPADRQRVVDALAARAQPDDLELWRLMREPQEEP